MSVSAWARLPTRRPCWNSELSAAPTVPSLLAGAQRLADLAEDLALADHHRVEPGRHLEQVRDRRLVVVHVEGGTTSSGRCAGQVAEQPVRSLDAAVEAVDLGVDLDPVAGGEHEGLA